MRLRPVVLLGRSIMAACDLCYVVYDMDVIIDRGSTVLLPLLIVYLVSV